MMTRIKVFKTIVPYPDKPQFVLSQMSPDLLQLSYTSLADMVAALRIQLPEWIPSYDLVCFENDVPADIAWTRSGDGAGVQEFQRLSRNEVRELARLLRG